MALTWKGKTIRNAYHSQTYQNNRLVHEVAIVYNDTVVNGYGHHVDVDHIAQCYMPEHKWLELFNDTNASPSHEAMLAAVSLHGWCDLEEMPAYDITGSWPDVHIQREKKQPGQGGQQVDDETAEKISEVLSKCGDALLNAINNYTPMTPSPYTRIQGGISSVYVNNEGGQVPLANSNPSPFGSWSAGVRRASTRWQEAVDAGISGCVITVSGGSGASHNVDQSGLDIDEEIKKILGTMKCAACDNALSHPHNMQPFLGNDEMKKYIKFCDETQQAPTLFCCSCYEIAEKYPRITDAYRTMINVTYKLGEAMKGVEKQIQSTMDAEAELTEWSAELKKKEDGLTARETLIVDLLKKAGIEK